MQEFNQEQQEQYLNDVVLFIKRIEETVKETAISYSFETHGGWHFPLVRCTMTGGQLGENTLVEEAIPDQYLFVSYRRPKYDDALSEMLSYNEKNRLLYVAAVESNYKTWSKLKSDIEQSDHLRLRNTGYLMALVVVLGNIHRHYRGDKNNIRNIIESINMVIASNLALLGSSTKDGEAIKKKRGFVRRVMELSFLPIYPSR